MRRFKKAPLLINKIILLNKKKLPTGITTYMRQEKKAVRIEILDSAKKKEQYTNMFYVLIFLWLTVVLSIVTYSLIMQQNLYTIMYVSPIYITIIIIYSKITKFILTIPKNKTNGF